MTQQYFVGIDVGAGSLTAMIIDLAGTVAGSASEELVTHNPHPGWSEQDPQDWWRALCKTIRQALAESGIRPEHIAAVSLSAGAHTPVLVDAGGQVVRPAILWSDTRSRVEAAELKDNHGTEIFDIACNVPAATWTQPQLLWLARHEPESLTRTKRLYVAKDWLRAQLTGTWETDHTEAAGTMLYDARRKEWSGRLCEMIGLDPSVLPPIVDVTDVIGGVTADAARETGLPVATPVVCGSSDTSIETYGAGAVAVGTGAVKLATAATITMVSPEPGQSTSVINYPFCVPDHWYLIGATNSCASAHRWLRDTFFAENGVAGAQAFASMDKAAGSVAPGAKGLLFHPYLQGERTPYWDPLLRGDFLGITFAHDRRHFVRALYEGVAFSLYDVLLALEEQGKGMAEARIIGGGSRSAIWRQIVADVLGITVVMPRITDASFGTALVAAVGAGAFPDLPTAAEHTVSIAARHEPNAQQHQHYRELHAIYRDAAKALFDVNHRLSALNKE
ncbi:xylulokinase [Pusillimonas sp. MFBS29]|uniref:xylulokinase n=1 Tax=Pusillimonas sp. MFBS29 TaxID=2886690 RepID=UPI001D12950A|nr:xylulokinase [Pusillimonas sp. MFBS29]MCC2594865.1 xylulokinase [Pusillimonas sp. MFBS29]